MAFDPLDKPPDGWSGWVEHDGGPCPVSPSTYVEIHRRSLGNEIDDADGWDFVWEHKGEGEADIISYRYRLDTVPERP